MPHHRFAKVFVVVWGVYGYSSSLVQVLCSLDFTSAMEKAMSLYVWFLFSL